MNPFRWIRQAIARRDPTSALSLAERKRSLERQLRADGWSKKAAATEVGRRLRNG